MTVDERLEELTEIVHHHITNDKEKYAMEVKEDKDKAPATGVVGTILGAIGTAAFLGLNGQGGGIFGGAGSKNQKVADLQAELAGLKAQQYTDKAILVERDRHIEWVKSLANQDARIEALAEKVEKQADKNAADIAAAKELSAKDLQIAKLESANQLLAVQNGLQAQITANTGAIACLDGRVTALEGLTKNVIPIGNVCPAPMPQYNSWTAPTTTTTTTA